MSEIERIENPTEAEFRRHFLERGKPVVITAPNPRPPQLDWTFESLVELAGDTKVQVYDWGDKGPTIEDDFEIVKMRFADAIDFARTVKSPGGQRYSVCQLPLEHLPPLAERYRRPRVIENSLTLDRLPRLFSERERWALFISFFRGIHWHNGREVIAQLATGRKKFFLYHPRQSRFLYPRKLHKSGLAWFDENEAVFCSEIPFEQGVDKIDRARFPLLERAEPIEVDLAAGESLYIPPHWWHYTVAVEPCIVVAHFWDSPLSRWGYPIAWRSLFMKPYRKYAYGRVLDLKRNLKARLSARA